MNWQKTIGLLLAGVGVVIAALWLSGPGSPLAKKAPAATTNVIRSVTATNATKPAVRPPANAASPQRPIPQRPVPGSTNVALVRTNRTGSTNAAASTAAGPYERTMQTVRSWQQHPWFLPVAAGVPLALGLLFALLSYKKSSSSSKAEAEARLPLASQRAAKRRRSSINQCNVLEATPQGRRLWHFGAAGSGFTLNREQAAAAGEPLPATLVAKDWRSLFQPRLNVAWLPAEQVFLKVVHLPVAGAAETLSMLEFQLEKLSPMPVAQVAWSVHPLPKSEIGTQSLILLIVARSVVEDFLGKLEQDRYLADRLDLPVLGQLQTLVPESNGAYVFPGAVGGADTALVAWYYGGILRSLDLVTVPSHDQKAADLREQLTQMAWGGELDGWLTSPPAWNLVSDDATAAHWEPLLKEAIEAEVKVETPIPHAKLAGLTASRAAQSGSESSLVPAELAARYHQQFVDTLWMRALAGVVGLYVVGVVLYMLAVQVVAFRVRGVESQVAGLSPSYTNAMQLKAQLEVLKDRQELKFAALDCWKAVAELLPETITMQTLTFRDGKRLSLQGTAPMGQVQQIYQFEGAMRKTLVNGQPLFHPTKGDTLSYHTAPGGAALSWSFALELKRSEEAP